jgi:hypothetical protein
MSFILQKNHINALEFKFSNCSYSQRLELVSNTSVTVRQKLRQGLHNIVIEQIWIGINSLIYENIDALKQ